MWIHLIFKAITFRYRNFSMGWIFFSDVSKSNDMYWAIHLPLFKGYIFCCWDCLSLKFKIPHQDWFSAVKFNEISGHLFVKQVNSTLFFTLVSKMTMLFIISDDGKLVQYGCWASHVMIKDAMWWLFYTTLWWFYVTSCLPPP